MSQWVPNRKKGPMGSHLLATSSLFIFGGGDAVKIHTFLAITCILSMNWSLSICLSLPFHGSLPCCFVGCQNTAHHAEPLFYSLLHFERQRKIACIEWKCPKHHTRLETWISHRQFPISSFSFSDPWVAWSRFFLWGLRCSALHEHVVGQRNNTWWFTTGTGKLVQIRLICPFIFISISIQYKKTVFFSIQHKKLKTFVLISLWDFLGENSGIFWIVHCISSMAITSGKLLHIWLICTPVSSLSGPLYRRDNGGREWLEISKKLRGDLSGSLNASLSSTRQWEEG